MVALNSCTPARLDRRVRFYDTNRSSYIRMENGFDFQENFPEFIFTAHSMPCRTVILTKYIEVPIGVVIKIKFDLTFLSHLGEKMT